MYTCEQLWVKWKQQSQTLSSYCHENGVDLVVSQSVWGISRAPVHTLSISDLSHPRSGTLWFTVKGSEELGRKKERRKNSEFGERNLIPQVVHLCSWEVVLLLTDAYFSRIWNAIIHTILCWVKLHDCMSLLLIQWAADKFESRVDIHVLEITRRPLGQ